MDYRLATLWPRANYAADKTETIDIDLIDAISRLVVVYEPDATAVNLGCIAHPAKCIPKIELVDGSDVLYALTGQEAQAIDFYDRGIIPPNIIGYSPPLYSKMIFNMNFGRRLFDPDLAFDPTKFRNPALKVSIDINGGGYTPDDGYLTVLAHLFDEKPASPVGFFMNKEIKDYSLGSASHEYTDLPMDFPYRQLFLRAQKYGTQVQDLIDIVKISQDVDRKIPLNHTMLQIISNMVQEWPLWVELMEMSNNTTTGEDYYCTPTDDINFADAVWREPALAFGISEYEGWGGRFTHAISTIVGNSNVLVSGHLPHAMVPLLPRLPVEDMEGYDISGIHSLKLDVLTLAAAAVTDSAQIIAQQIRKY